MPPVGVQITQPSQSSVSDPVLWVLAIGVNQTQVLSLPELHFAAADCQDFVSALTTATQPLTRTHWAAWFKNRGFWVTLPRQNKP